MAAKKKQTVGTPEEIEKLKHELVLAEKIMEPLVEELRKTAKEDPWGEVSPAFLKQDKKIEKLKQKLAQLQKDPKNLELEKKFEEAQKEAEKQFAVHLKAAEAEIDKAVKLAKQTGIPFESSLSETYNSFIPKTFFTKWKKHFSEEYMEELMDNIDLGEYYDDGDEFEGWTKSFC